jgi:hypothetical protein
MALDDFSPASDLPEPQLDAPRSPMADGGDDLFDFDEAATPAPQEAAAPEAQEGPRACTGLDPELDVDLFGFPPMDLSSLGIPASAPGVEDQLDAAAQSVEDLLQDELVDDEPFIEAPAPERPQAIPAEPPAAPVAAAPAPVTAPAGPLPTAPVVVASAPASSAIWVLTASVVLFLFGMLGVAWRATSNFQQGLEQVRTEVDRSADRIGERTASELRELVAEQTAARSEASAGPRIPALEPLHETSLTLAEEAVSEGRFADARRTLFQLLAEADRLPATDRTAVERRAAFLIAESHKLEADSLQEVAR